MDSDVGHVDRYRTGDTRRTSTNVDLSLRLSASIPIVSAEFIDDMYIETPLRFGDDQ